ncbi:unnamed protein product [Gadus morhua 'NCC']
MIEYMPSIIVFDQRHSWALEEIWVLSAEEDPVGDNGSPQGLWCRPLAVPTASWQQNARQRTISILRTPMAGPPPWGLAAIGPPPWGLARYRTPTLGLGGREASGH